MKRVVDIVAAGALLVILAPLMLFLAALVRVSIGSPVFFAQKRPGRGERPFTMFKFRTMRPPRHGEDPATTDAKRITPVGAILRKTSLDELPELWNVLRGDMSLVGPRPLLNQYLPYYTAEERARFLVRPGITGLAQVRGRNASSWNERLAMDVEYVRSRTFLLDARILVATVGSVIAARHVVVDPRSVMRNLDEERQPAVPTL